MASDPAAAFLISAMNNADVPWAVRERCAAQLLARAHITSRQEIELMFDSPWYGLIVDGLTTEVDDDQIARVSRIVSGDGYADETRTIVPAFGLSETDRLALMGVHRWAFTAGSVSEPPVGEHLLTQVCSEDLRLDRAPAGERGGLYGWWDVAPGALIH